MHKVLESNTANIAVFGGSFDPLHNGHMGIIEYLITHFKLNTLILLPTFCSPFKQTSLFSPSERLIMCQLAQKYLEQTYLNAPHIWVCDFEITAKRTTYTIESVRFLQSTLFGAHSSQRLLFVLGWDSFLQFNLWKDSHLLAQSLELLVFDRGKHNLQDFQALKQTFALPDLLAHFIPYHHTISSSMIRENLRNQNFSQIPNFLTTTIKELLQKHCYNS